MATKGYAAPEVEHVYTRVRELCQQVGETPELFPVLFGLWRFYVVRAELQTAYDLARQLLTIAQRQHAPALLIGAHWALGATMFFRGELAPARTHLEQGIALYASQRHRALTCLYAVDPGVVFHSYASWVLWLQGYPDQAARQSHAALSLAQGLAHPYSLTWTLGFATLQQYFRREVQTVHEQAEATITLATEQGFPLFLALGMVLRGWSLAVQGHAAAGMPQIQQGVTALRTLGVQVFLPCCLAILAEAYGQAGQPEAGLPVLAEALEAARQGHLCWWEAELYRLQGELFLRGSAAHHAEAECCFQHALTVARRQQARSLALRAATSLSSLWQRQGKADAARQLLAPISGWFTEGFESADLQQARALLDELA
jgi:predicted ATPase